MWNNVDMATQSAKTKKKSSSTGLQLRTKVKAGCVGGGCTVGGIGNHNETLVDRSINTRRGRDRG